MPKPPLVLLCTADLFADQLPHLADLTQAQVTHERTRHEHIAEIAAAILAAAPPRFALAGLSLGGYIALEIVRQAAGRVKRLALLDTTARADTPESRPRCDGGSLPERHPDRSRDPVRRSRWTCARGRDWKRHLQEPP